MDSHADTILAGAEDSDETLVSGSARRWWVRGVLGAVVVLVLISVGLLVSAWRHPSAFPDAGGWGVGKRDQQVNEPFFVGMTYPDQDAEGTVRIGTVKGHTVADTAEAELSYFVCTIDTAVEGSIGTGSKADVGEFCSTLTPADGASLSLGYHPREQLLLAVTPTRQGLVKIHGLDVTYTHGWQHGTQRIGGDVRVRTVGSGR